MKHIIIATLSFAVAAALQAALITDYLEYGTNSASLTSLTTSETAGWGANAWSGSANPIYNVSTQSYGGISTPLWPTLELSVSGYVNNAAGGVLLGRTSAGSVTRDLAVAQSGDVWVSVLIASTFWGAGGAQDHGYFQINGDSSDWFGLYSPLAVMAVVENGTETNSSSLGYSNTQLVVAKMASEVSGANDELTVWFIRDGADLTGQNVAALDAAAHWKYQSGAVQDIWGSSISSVGCDIQSARDPYDPASGQERFAYMDNLRLSYGHTVTNYSVYEVLTGVPVPEPGLAIALAAIGMVALRRS
jgi:hypothetical protein